MKPEIQLTAREKRQMMRVLFNESVSLKEAAKIKVRPLCCPTNEESAEMECPEDRCPLCWYQGVDALKVENGDYCEEHQEEMR